MRVKKDEQSWQRKPAASRVSLCSEVSISAATSGRGGLGTRMVGLSRSKLETAMPMAVMRLRTLTATASTVEIVSVIPQGMRLALVKCYRRIREGVADELERGPAGQQVLRNEALAVGMGVTQIRLWMPVGSEQNIRPHGAEGGPQQVLAAFGPRVDVVEVIRDDCPCPRRLELKGDPDRRELSARDRLLRAALDAVDQAKNRR